MFLLHHEIIQKSSRLMSNPNLKYLSQCIETLDSCKWMARWKSCDLLTTLRLWLILSLSYGTRAEVRNAIAAAPAAIAHAPIFTNRDQSVYEPYSFSHHPYQRASSESSEYAAAVAAPPSREKAPVTLTDEQYHDMVHIKVGNKTKRPKTTLTVENLKRKGYAIESWDKETGLITLKARNKSDNQGQNPQRVQVKQVILTPTTTKTTTPEPEIIEETSTITPVEEPSTTVFEPKQELITTPAPTVPTLVEVTTTATTTPRPTPSANYKTTTEKAMPAKTVEQIKEMISSKKCPSFKDFINGSVDFWNGLTNSDDIPEGFGVLLDAAKDSFASISQCVTKIISDTVDWFGKVPAGLSKLTSLFSSPKNSSVPVNKTKLQIATPGKRVARGGENMPGSEREKPIHVHLEKVSSSQNDHQRARETQNEAVFRRKDSPAALIENEEKRDREDENPDESVSHIGKEKYDTTGDADYSK